MAVRFGAEGSARWPHPVAAIGNFDGVHLGHRALVETVVRLARRRAGTAVALTFEPHPARVLAPERAPLALTTPAQKEELLRSLGIEQVGVLPFTPAVASLAPEAFVRQVLVGELGLCGVVVGEGFRFGLARAGGVELLRRLGAELGFGVEAQAPVSVEGEPVSSSRVREALLVGDVGKARALLGRVYWVEGRVVEGEQRGRQLGFPTANLDLDNELAPAPGVYLGRLRCPDGRWRTAVVNRGHRPTFSGRSETVEAHVLDFTGNLYGARSRLAFLERLRDERRFESAAQLVDQIGADVARARELASLHEPV